MYVLGAGFNKAFRKHPHEQYIEAFVSDNFFNYVVKENPEFEGSGLDQYISNKWNISYRDLLKGKTLNLEKFFTGLDMPSDPTSFGYNPEEYQIFLQAVHLLGQLVGRINITEDSNASRLAQSIIRSNEPVITFNYDTVLERLIESQLSTRIKCYEEPYIDLYKHHPDKFRLTLPPAIYRWKRQCCYGFEFDDIALIECSGPLPYFSRKDYYSYFCNDETTVEVLKLHGCITWFNVEWEDGSRGLLIDDTGYRRLVGGSLTTTYKRCSRYLPLLIAPSQIKKFNDQPFATIWGKAKVALEQSDRIVFIGYSFPSGDQHFKVFMDEVIEFSKFRKEMIIVNPDQKVTSRVEAMWGRKASVLWMKCLDDYMESPYFSL